MNISILQIEAAINHWRMLKPADQMTCAVCGEVNQLANVYATLIFEKKDSIAEVLLNDTQKRALDIDPAV